MCLAPQRRAIFGDLKVQKCPEHVMLSTFWVANVLRTTATCHFWTAETKLQEGVRDGKFFTFRLANVLLATAACNFSTSQLQKMLRAENFWFGPEWATLLTWLNGTAVGTKVSWPETGAHPCFFASGEGTWKYIYKYIIDFSIFFHSHVF